MSSLSVPQSQRRYFDFIRADYRPTRFESSGGDARFVDGAHNAWVNGFRFWRMLRMFDRHLAKEGEAGERLGLDIGTYPGTWIRLARRFWPGVRWHGVGLCMSEEFRDWAASEGIELVEAEMDPFYAKAADRLPYADGSVDLIVASEIFEHLISPLHFLAEASRVLKPGGTMLLTTPNVSNIGAVAHLLCGDSNYERLPRSPMFLADNEWRGHIRFYSKRELAWLGERYALTMIDHCYYHDDYPLHVLRQRGLKARLKMTVRRLFGVVPWFRGGHILMLQKEAG